MGLFLNKGMLANLELKMLILNHTAVVYHAIALLDQSLFERALHNVVSNLTSNSPELGTCIPKTVAFANPALLKISV